MTTYHHQDQEQQVYHSGTIPHHVTTTTATTVDGVTYHQQYSPYQDSPRTIAINGTTSGFQPSNYTVFPSPIPMSPLKESPLTHYPPYKHHGVAQKVKSESQSARAHVKTRSGTNYERYRTSETVYSPYYNSRMSYQPVTEQSNSLAPYAQGTHLYHHPDSVDSMKVRMALAEKNQKWVSDIVNTPNNQHLSPDYMALNPRGSIPTLVVDGRVTTDARNIVNYLNHFPGPNLVPNDQAEVEAMEHFVDLSDRQNIEALTFGKIPGVKKRTFKSPYANRRGVIHNHMNVHANNRNLVEAYKQKDAQSTHQEDIIHTPDKMRCVFGNVQHYLGEVEQQLTSGPFAFAGWLVSDQFTLADIHTLCFLRFLDTLGLSHIMGQNTARYYSQGKTRHSYLTAGTEWTSAYGRVTKHYVPEAYKTSRKNKKCLIMSSLGALALGLLGALGFFAWKFLKGRKANAIVPTPHIDYDAASAQKHVVVDHHAVIDGDVLADNTVHHVVHPWMKYALMLAPALLLLPLLLWLCGCIKCKKKHGRTRPSKAIVYDESRSGEMKRTKSISRSRSRRSSDSDTSLSDSISAHEPLKAVRKSSSESDRNHRRTISS